MGEESYFLALVVTDEGETETFLRSQLHLTKELLYLQCGPSGLTNAGLHARRISSMIGTMTRLCSLRQSFLVQSTEELLAHSNNSANVNDSISSLLAQKTASIANIHHAILCVGTKIVSVARRPKSQALTSQDLFLLTLFFSSHFEPYHLPKQAAPGSSDEEYAHLHRPLDITSQVLAIGSKYRLIELTDAFEVAGIEGIASTTTLDCVGPIIAALKRVLVHATLHDGEISPVFDEGLAKTLIKLQLEYNVDPAAGQLCMATLKAIVRYVIYPTLPSEEDAQGSLADEGNATSSSASASRLPASGKLPALGSPASKNASTSKSSSSAAPNSPHSRMSQAIAPAPASNEPPPLTDLEEAIIAIRYLVDDRPKVTDEEMHVTRVYQTCYLSSFNYAPGTIYLARFMNRITLVLLSSAKTETAEEKNALESVEKAVQEELEANYGSYILSMESSYTMITYIHLLPGLVHFIYVERTSNKFIAPEISHLGGEVTPAQIKRHVWHLCYQSTEFLSRGAFEMVQTNGPFQYSYKLFFMDNSGAILQPREQRTIEHKTPVNPQFYKRLTSQLFPSQPMRCFELFTLYVGSISHKLIQKHNDALISLLNKKMW